MPKSQSSLLELEGVGPKIAHLVLSVGLGVARTGIVVDTHVQRCVCVCVREREIEHEREMERERERDCRRHARATESGLRSIRLRKVSC